jgi:protoporphyrinogen oxidase
MILILGGGLAGLSTAYHLGKLGVPPHLVLEREARPGGLCRTREIDGFLFDYTGHLLHLRDPEIVALVEDLLPERLILTERRAAIHSRGRRLEFPFQAHLHGLPPEVVARCLVDFVQTLRQDPPVDEGELSFRDWALGIFGQGICDEFMFPYNRKLFCREPETMTADWVSWAVPRPDLEQVVRGALGLPNRGMGYNPSFRYPETGGIGVLPAALAERVPALRTGAEVVEVDLPARTLTLASGESLAWERLVNTLPLPHFLRILKGAPEGLAGAAERLAWTVVLDLNLGLDRPDLAGGDHWLYFPEPEYPFYRVGFPSNICPAMVPEGCGSMYVEFAERPGGAHDLEELERSAREGLRRAGLLDGGERILARDLAVIDPGYVVFDRERARAVPATLEDLRGLGVHSIGRYGAWTYSYMERALRDGLDTARLLAEER